MVHARGHRCDLPIGEGVKERPEILGRPVERRIELMQSLFYQFNICGANEAKIKKAFEARDCYRAKQSDFSSHILTTVGCGEFKTVEKMFLLTPHQHSLVLWFRKGECY